MTFSITLQNKITQALQQQQSVQLGTISLPNNLFFAPMAGISNKSYRRLMEQLGAGATVSELISAKAISYKNKKTIDMLRLAPTEQNVGLQLFGEAATDLAYAAQVAQEYEPKFIDLNLGCPVKKVVGSGAGSALLKEPKLLGKLFATVKKSISIPLTIKIRTGWDMDHRNADEVLHVAHEEGIEWVALHGRTRSQQYKGKADWNYIENLAIKTPLPLIGNGDLHSAPLVQQKMETTKCQALMIARGALRFPFIFLESLDASLTFTTDDYHETLQTLLHYFVEDFASERLQLIQTRKHAAWFAAGFPHSARFRQQLFTTQTIKDLETMIADYFKQIQGAKKHLDLSSEFMTSGHG